MIKLDLIRLADYLVSNSRTGYIRVRDLAYMLGVSSKSAGKILARMESLGMAARYSNNVYRIMIKENMQTLR